MYNIVIKQYMAVNMHFENYFFVNYKIQKNINKQKQKNLKGD